MKFIKWANSHAWIYTVAIISFVITPFVVQFVPVFYGEHSTHGDWLGFWGSYLGVMPAGLIAYTVARYQIKSDKEKQNEDYKRKFELEKLTNIYKKSASISNKLELIDEQYRILNHFIIHTKSNLITSSATREIISSNFSKRELSLIIENISEIISDVFIYGIFCNENVFDADQLQQLELYKQTLMDNYRRAINEGTYEDPETNELFSSTEAYAPIFMTDIEQLHDIINILNRKLKKQLQDVLINNQAL